MSTPRPVFVHGRSDEGQLDGFPPAIRRVLVEGLADGRCGEVIIRRGDAVGRIYTWKGNIAWVTCDAVPARLRDLLHENAGVEIDAIHAVVAECREKGTNFGETLLAWGLLDDSMLRACMLDHNATHLMGIRRLGAGTSAIFVPRARGYSGALSFSLEELVAKCEELREDAKTLRPPPLAPSRLGPSYDRIPDCTALFVLNQDAGEILDIWPGGSLSASDGVLLGEAGNRLLADTRLVALEPGPAHPAGVREVLLFADDALLMLRRSTGPIVFGVVCANVRNPGLTLGMARLVLPSLAAMDWPVAFEE